MTKAEMSKPRGSMSTIEKAAAKLSAQRRASESVPIRPLGTGSDGPDVAGTPAATAPPPASLQAAYDNAADRSCTLNLEDLKARGYIEPTAGRTVLAQQMRRIKRPLLLNIRKDQVVGESGNPPNLIMVSSAVPGEGKTFISINLALSMAAEIDRRVLLVDADVARGDISRQLGLPASRGLSDILREFNYLSEDGVLSTNVDRLSILPAGHPVDGIDELFASQLMAEILREIAAVDPDRIVIFDGPPLLATTEAAVLARQMGQVVVVVEANRTPEDAVRQALVELEDCQNVSLVLNKTTGGDSPGYGYGYAGYSYGEEGTPADRA